jgi:flavin reductase (DIM6/NTAB) family NADH-FMN oxidoreductase RutF
MEMMVPESRVAQSGFVSAAEYKSLMSGFPTGVSVVTSVGEDQQPHGITCSSLVSVTLEPPTLLVCIWFGSPTLAAVRESGRFAVNLLHARARATAELFCTPIPDRFRRVAWRRSPALGLPWLDADAFAFAECSATDLVTVGDHVLMLGQVTTVVRHDNVPLLYGMRRFSVWPEAEDGAHS